MLVLFMLAGLPGFVGRLSGQDLRFQSDRTFLTIRGRSAGGQILYELRELAELLALEIRSDSDRTAEIRGPRGSLILTEGRPLLRFREDYILLSSAVRKATDGSWFVPEDILEKGLVQILDRQLEKTGPQSYRLQVLDTNVVRVDLVNYPDHVAVIFSSSKQASFRVREFRRYLRVEFEGYAIEPQISQILPKEELVREVRFDSFDRFGGFEIVKGDDYFSYREYTLSDPDRQVVGIYGKPRAVASEAAGDLRNPLPDPSRPVTADPLLHGNDEAPEFNRNRESRVITLDPGHGADDLGVLPTQEIQESKVAWQVSEQIREFLGRSRFEPRLTRNEGMNPSLEQRSAQANADRSRVFVSIHVGGAASAAVRGPVVYVHRYFDRESTGESVWKDWNDGQRESLPQSRRLAAILQRKLNLVFGLGNETAEAPLALLAPLQAPAVLIELGFLSNEEDLLLLQNPEFLRQIAAALASGLEEFLQ